MADMGPFYVVLATVGLGGVIGFALHLARSHERQMQERPDKTRAEYVRAFMWSILVAASGAVILAVGLFASVDPVSWVGGVAISAGVMVLAYNAFGYIDTVPAQARLQAAESSKQASEPVRKGATSAERLVGTLLVVFGLLTFLSWGLDFIAFPSAGITLLLLALWVLLRVGRARGS